MSDKFSDSMEVVRVGDLKPSSIVGECCDCCWNNTRAMPGVLIDGITPEAAKMLYRKCEVVPAGTTAEIDRLKEINKVFDRVADNLLQWHKMGLIPEPKVDGFPGNRFIHFHNSDIDQVIDKKEDAWKDDRAARSRASIAYSDHIPMCGICGIHKSVTSVDGVCVCSEECQNEVLKKKDSQTKANERGEMNEARVYGDVTVEDDGDMKFARFSDFTDLMESVCAFDPTDIEAVSRLAAMEHNTVKKLEIKIQRLRKINAAMLVALDTVSSWLNNYNYDKPSHPSAMMIVKVGNAMLEAKGGAQK